MIYTDCPRPDDKLYIEIKRNKLSEKTGWEEFLSMGKMSVFFKYSEGVN